MAEETISRTPFTDVGSKDVEVGAELFKALDITQVELTDPTHFAKLRDITEFLNDHPDPVFLIQSLRRSNKNPSNSNLDHFAAFVQLSRSKSATEEKLVKLNKELSHYN